MCLCPGGFSGVPLEDGADREVSRGPGRTGLRWTDRHRVPRRCDQSEKALQSDHLELSLAPRPCRSRKAWERADPSRWPPAGHRGRRLQLTCDLSSQPTVLRSRARPHQPQAAGQGARTEGRLPGSSRWAPRSWTGTEPSGRPGETAPGGRGVGCLRDAGVDGGRCTCWETLSPSPKPQIRPCPAAARPPALL